MSKIANKTLIAAGATIVIVAISVLAVLFANVLFPLSRLIPPYTSEWLMLLRTLLALITLGLSSYLIFIYLRDYLELRSGFTLALLISIIAFMLYALTSNPWVHTACGVSPTSDIFTLIPMAFATIALAILAWVSSK